MLPCEPQILLHCTGLRLYWYRRGWTPWKHFIQNNCCCCQKHWWKLSNGVAEKKISALSGLTTKCIPNGSQALRCHTAVNHFTFQQEKNIGHLLEMCIWHPWNVWNVHGLWNEQCKHVFWWIGWMLNMPANSQQHVNLCKRPLCTHHHYCIYLDPFTFHPFPLFLF